MTRILILLLSLTLGSALSAQEKMFIHQSGQITSGVRLTGIDSLYFSPDGTLVIFRIGETLARFAVAEIDSLTFGAETSVISVTYNGASVSVSNPLAFEGVTVGIEGAHVTISSVGGDREFTCRLSGTSAAGSLKIYSMHKFNLEFNGLILTNPEGPAINIQTKKKCSLWLNAGTLNSLTDGATYLPGAEDQKSTLFSEGQIEIDGTGSLTVRSLSAHAICSDDYIRIRNGSILVPEAAKDGIHARDHFEMSGGSIEVNSIGDAVECQEGTVLISAGKLNLNTTGNAVLTPSGAGFDPSFSAGIKSDSTLTITGGDITVNGTGKGSKGISSDGDILMTGGSLNISVSSAGATYLNSNGEPDSYNITCITADGHIRMIGGWTACSATGSGGKGITGDSGLTVGDSVNSPVVYIAASGTRFLVSGNGSNGNYNESKGISLDGPININNGDISISATDDGLKSKTSITINGGNLSVTRAREGIESPFVTVNNGTIGVASTDDGINVTKGNGGEANDGSMLTLNGGNLVVTASGGDGLDSNGSITMTGGTVIVHGPQSAPETGMDSNGTITVSGGFLVVSGTNSNMTEGPGASSTQYSILARSSAPIGASTLFHIQDASGAGIVTFSPVRSYYTIVLSSAALIPGTTYHLYTGGSSTGTNTHGWYTDGIYSGGTQKKSFTLSGKLTTITY